VNAATKTVANAKNLLIVIFVSSMYKKLGTELPMDVAHP
jgi:hypothetical protein